MVQGGCRLTHFDVLHIFQICVNPTPKKKEKRLLASTPQKPTHLAKIQVWSPTFWNEVKECQRNICLLLQTVMEESNWLYCRRLQPQARLAVAAPIEGLQARRHWGPSLLCTRWEICGHDIILFPQWVSLYVSVASSYELRKKPLTFTFIWRLIWVACAKGKCWFAKARESKSAPRKPRKLTCVDMCIRDLVLQICERFAKDVRKVRESWGVQVQDSPYLHEVG